MRIDRARFVRITAALAASTAPACGKTTALTGAELCLIGPGKSCNPAGWCAFGDPDTKFIPKL